MAENPYVVDSPDINKGIATRIGWWVRTAFAGHAVSGAWRFVLVVASLVRILPRRLRGTVIEVRPAGTQQHLLVRVGTSDLRILEDIYLCEEYKFPLNAAPAVIVDVGAYTGLSTAWFATQYPNARVIAVEPSGSNFELLAKNTSSMPNVQRRHAALWDEHTSLKMVDPGYGPFGFRVGRASDAAPGDEGEPELVEAITVADIAEEFALDRIDLLKVDIEGSEVEVFSHAAGWMDRVDAVCLELHDRLRPGCSRAFFSAVGDFPVEVRRGESLLVTRR